LVGSRKEATRNIMEGINMKRPTRVSLATLLPLLLLMASNIPGNITFGQDLPPGPKTIYKSSMPGQTIQGEFELVNLILDFAPGAATPPHTHGGPGIVTVLTEEIVFGMEGKPDTTAKPGEAYLDVPGMVHTAANKTSGTARVSFAVALPKGAPLTTVVGGPPSDQLPPGPKPVHRSSLSGLTMEGEFELINLILEFAPGAATPLHTHGGPGIVTVLEGEVVFGVEGKPDMVAKSGEFYLDLPGTPHTAANKGSTPARVSYVIALPKGAPLTTVVGGAQPQASPTPQQQVGEHGEHLGMPRTGVQVSLLPFVLALTLGLLGLGLVGLARHSSVRQR
jgi:quercetin dioxygenase-like cupin family protein